MRTPPSPLPKMKRFCARVAPVLVLLFATPVAAQLPEPAGVRFVADAGAPAAVPQDAPPGTRWSPPSRFVVRSGAGSVGWLLGVVPFILYLWADDDGHSFSNPTLVASTVGSATSALFISLLSLGDRCSFGSRLGRAFVPAVVAGGTLVLIAQSIEDDRLLPAVPPATILAGAGGSLTCKPAGRTVKTAPPRLQPAGS
jgi:hypothetical protein